MNYTILSLKCYINSFYTDIILKQKKIVEHIHNTFTVPCEKSKIVSFASSIIKNIAMFPSRSRFVVKLICCIAFGSVSIAYSLLKSMAIIL